MNDACFLYAVITPQIGIANNTQDGESAIATPILQINRNTAEQIESMFAAMLNKERDLSRRKYIKHAQKVFEHWVSGGAEAPVMLCSPLPLMSFVRLKAERGMDESGNQIYMIPDLVTITKPEESEIEELDSLAKRNGLKLATPNE